MLALRFNLLRNSFRSAPLLTIVGVLAALGFAFAAYAGVLAFLNYLQTELTEAYRLFPFGEKLARTTQKVIADRSLASLLLLMTSANVLSALPGAVSVLYTSEDLPLHLALPQKARNVFLFKVGEVFVSTSLFPALLSVPVIFAFGHFYNAPWIFYPASSLLIFALFSFPVFIGVGLALPLVRFAPAGRAREWSAAVGAVLGGGLIFVLRALRPEALIKADFANPEALDSFLKTFRTPTGDLLPSALASTALDKLFIGQFSTEFWVLILLSLGLLLLAGTVAGFAYQQGWVRTLEGTVSEKGIFKPGWLDQLSKSNLFTSLWVRDFRIFFRDANQASQLILVGVLVLLYTTSLGYVPVDSGNPVIEKSLKTVLAFLHLAFEGFVIGGVGIRLAYPLFSLEGQGYWMLQTGPISRAAILFSRFGLALFFLIPAAIALGYFSPRVIGMSPALISVSILVAISAAIVAAGVGSGIGAAFPKLDSANPSDIVVGAGGLLYMGITLLHSVLLTVLASRPVFQVLIKGQSDYLGTSEGAIWLAILALITILPIVPSLMLGLRRLNPI